IAPPRDVSGIYEAFTDPGHAIGRHIPCLLVQLNQAGRAIAGWFTRPPVNVGGPKHLRLNIPEPPELFRDVETAVLLGQYDGRFRFNWGLTDNLEADPVVDSLDGQASGLLEVQGKVLKMTVRRDDLQCTLYLHQQQPTSRWSSKAWQVLRARTLGALHERFTYDAFLGQIRPAPLAFWNQLGMDLCADGTLGKLIIEHYAVTGTERDVKRSKINTYLVALTSQERYRNVMVAQFFGKAGGIALEVNGKVQTVLAWLEKIQNDHLDEIDRTAKSRGEPLKTEQLLARADRGFVDLGIVHKHVYLYRIEFFPVGAKLPIKGWSIGAYAAPVTITRWVLKEGGGSEADDSRRDEEFGPPPRHALETFATF